MNGQGNAIIGAIGVLVAVIFIALLSINKIFPSLEDATGVKTPSSFIIALILVIIAAVIGFILVLLKKS